MRLSRATALASLMTAVVACTGNPQPRQQAGPTATAAPGTPASTPRVGVGPITDISQGPCAPQNAEVEATAWHDYVYAAWICLLPRHQLRIGFARSVDGGRTWSAPAVMPGSSSGWDPAVAVAPDGTLYVSFMVAANRSMYPVVDVSRDQGRTFPRTTRLAPATSGNFGDRPFIATGASGLVYVTWDYGPSAAQVRAHCVSGGSCAFSAGDVNIVIQKSTDYGLTWTPPVHVSPGFPASGADL